MIELLSFLAGFVLGAGYMVIRFAIQYREHNDEA